MKKHRYICHSCHALCDDSWDRCDYCGAERQGQPGDSERDYADHQRKLEQEDRRE